MELVANIINYGIGCGVLLFVMAVIIEWTPIKVNPIGWIGDRFNRRTIANVEKIERKLDNHIADDYRGKILHFQNECVDRRRHTHEEFKKIIAICDVYERHIEENHMTNGEVTEAMDYIKRVYRKCLDEGDFVDLQLAPLSSRP